jgi:hypothetical protein
MAFDPVAFVEQHGVVLASAKGPVPNLAEAIAKEAIRGSWWSHPKGQAIFRALGRVDDSEDVLCFRLVAGKLTFVHRRLWPALVRLADEIGNEALAAIRQEHTASGEHRNVVTPFPDWVSTDLRHAAALLSAADARDALGAWMKPPPAQRRARKARPRKPS